jgi:RNA polymerase sigma-70 factor (ECF subfamily)
MTAVEFDYTITSATKYLKPFAMRLTKNMEDANDLLQDTMLKAVTHKDKFADGTSLKAWLYTIMKNTFITNYKRLVRRKTFIDVTDNLYFIDSPDSTTQNQAFNDFAMADISTAMNLVDESYIVPFEMYFNGFKYQEISEKLDIPIGTVKNRIHIARKELKSRIESMQRVVATH